MKTIDAIQPINIAAAWDNKSLRKEDSWTYQLTKNDIEELGLALKHLKSCEIKSYSFTKKQFPLPTLSKKLLEISDILENGLGLFLLRNFPVQQYSETDIRLMYAGVGTYLGTLIRQSLKGELIHDVKDEGKKLTDKTGRGTTTKDFLPFHNDRCDVVSLLCLTQCIQGGQSWVTSAVSIHNEIAKQRPDLLEVLYQPYYHARASWETTETDNYYPLPIFSNFQGYFAVRYLRHFTNVAHELPGVPKMTDKQVEALNLVEQLATDTRFRADMDFLPGDIQILNNLVNLHAREGYEDDEKSKRHLLRLWLSVPNSRPLSPAFAPLFVNTEAGQLRGGLPDGKSFV